MQLTTEKIQFGYFQQNLVNTYNRSDVGVWIRKRWHVLRYVGRMRPFCSHLKSPRIGGWSRLLHCSINFYITRQLDTANNT